nr:sugar nucleotide-binding protein [Rhodococcus sp. (in: high G+C Gram-positive bacteria)]
MERVLITGGTGFVGGNVAEVLTARGADVLCAVRRDPGPDFPWTWRLTDLSDPVDIDAAMTEHSANSVLHLAIDNDLIGLYSDRRAGFDAYVGMTRRIVDAANRAGARVGYLSTDWVHDGTSHMVPEDLPVSPVNLYGLFKALSEQTVLDRADAGFVARVGGVQGRHLTRPSSPREQDCGFGYFVLSLVDALSAGREFTVWQADDINGVASPIIAAEIGALLLRAIEKKADGILHLVGADAVTRRELAEKACAVFDLDPKLVKYGAVPDGARIPAPMPFDTSLSTPRTDEILGTSPGSITAQLRGLRQEVETGASAPLTA